MAKKKRREEEGSKEPPLPNPEEGTVLCVIERLLGADSLSVAASSNEGVGAVEPSGDAEASVPARGEAPWRLEKTPRTSAHA